VEAVLGLGLASLWQPEGLIGYRVPVSYVFAGQTPTGFDPRMDASTQDNAFRSECEIIDIAHVPRSRHTPCRPPEQQLGPPRMSLALSVNLRCLHHATLIATLLSAAYNSTVTTTKPMVIEEVE
jgi:hypothetical protein